MARKTKTSTGLKHTVRSSLKANREDNMKKSRRSAGHRAYENGRTLEARLEALKYYYQNAEKFEIEWVRNYEATSKFKGRKSNPAEHQHVVSPCDFSFFCGKTCDYLCGMVEAKSRNGNRINKNAVSVHQRMQLWRLEKLNQFGFVCVSLIDTNDEAKIFMVPIKNWFRGEKTSHNCEDLDNIGYRCNMVLDPETNMLLPDVLEVFHDVSDNGLKDVPPEYKAVNFNKKPYDSVYKEFEELYGETIDVDFDDY